jgi:ABC-2 type transport system ATP-binding protein
VIFYVNMLRVRKISKRFGKKEILKKISFDIEEKSVVGLLGPNGAGKTTLMRILVGFYTANSGKILWNKKIVNTKSRIHRSRIGYLPENNPLYPNMTPGEYLELVAKLKQIPDCEIHNIIMTSSKQCGIDDVLGQKIETLSKGYRQRVGLAAAILGNPQILILDEPTAGLDPKQIVEIRGLIKNLAKQKMILFSTHILTEAKEVCNRLLLINKGKIVLDEETKKIKNIEKKFIELTE